MAILSRLQGFYHWIPVGPVAKSRLKNAFFLVARPLVRRSFVYKAWETSRARHAGARPLPHPRLDERALAPEASGTTPGQSSPQREGVATPGVGDELPSFGWGDLVELRHRIDRHSRVAIEGYQPTPPRELLSITASEWQSTLAFDCPAEEPTVSLIIPVFNEFDVTLDCLRSIRERTDDVVYEVIVADDASTDPRMPELSSVTGLRYLRNETNLGFLLNCNRASRCARGRYLLFLNSDIQVTHGWLTALLHALESNPLVGAVAPKYIYPDGRLQEAGARVRPDGSSVLVGVGDDPSRHRYNYSREIPYASGACLLVPRALFEELGGFDEGYAPAYCEDVDLCLRLRERGFLVLYEPTAVVIHHLSKSSANVAMDFKLACVRRNQQRLATRWQDELDDLSRVRVIAFYLPQFHPIPENDLWWGKGFTDWTNVVTARPNFVGHWQPHLPADLGFYDLRLPEVLDAQARLARRYGLAGFCFYYYNFEGRRILEAPLDRWIESGRRGMPFCLCWANESWTKHWDGDSGSILLEQSYSDQGFTTVVHDLIRYLQHPEYIRVNGRPLILVYRIGLLPSPATLAALWRSECRAAGIGEIYLAFVETFEQAVEAVDPATIGFDACVEFPPHHTSRPIDPGRAVVNPRFAGVVSDYREIAFHYATMPLPRFKRFRCAMPGWDNTPRQQDRPYIFANASPGAFQAWLETLVEQTLDQHCGDEQIVFINAWNEWAEGAHLEPDRRFGHGFLQSVRNALDRSYVSRSRGG